MLFADVFDSRDVLEFIRRIRRNTALTYAIALGCVTVATALRFAIQGEVSDSVPFTTYSIALIVGTIFGGFLPGMAVLTLAAAGGWYLFLPPAFSFDLEPKEKLALVLFVIVAQLMLPSCPHSWQAC